MGVPTLRRAGHLDIQCRVITKAMKAKAEAELFAAVMTRRTKARAVRVFRAQAGIPRTPPVKKPAMAGIGQTHEQNPNQEQWPY